MAINPLIAGIALNVGGALGIAAAKRFSGLPASIGKGAIPSATNAAAVNIVSANGNLVKKDQRVKIRVPDDYLVALTRGPADEIYNLNGIIFPYTPTITYEHKADFASAQPLHSNFPLYFYQKSGISPINISGKFTVQNQKDAAVYLSTVHLLRSLVKMQENGNLSDGVPGSPPPVCRLDAYGEFMLENVPVSIGNFKVDLPDNVDYFTTTLGTTSASQRFGETSVPTISTISITCYPMYSRAELQSYSVTGWLSNVDGSNRKAGYL